MCTFIFTGIRFIIVFKTGKNQRFPRLSWAKINIHGQLASVDLKQKEHIKNTRNFRKKKERK